MVENFDDGLLKIKTQNTGAKELWTNDEKKWATTWQNQQMSVCLAKT